MNLKNRYWTHPAHGKKRFKAKWLKALVPHTAVVERSLAMLSWNGDGTLRKPITVGSVQGAKNQKWKYHKL